MYDDFLVVSNYDKLSSKLLSGNLTVIVKVSFFLIFLLERLSKFALTF